MGSKKSKDYVPLAMWLFLLTGILAFAFVRSVRGTGVWSEGFLNGDTVFIGLYILWMVIELRVTRKDIRTEGKKISDFATCQLYGTSCRRPCRNTPATVTISAVPPLSVR